MLEPFPCDISPEIVIFEAKEFVSPGGQSASVDFAYQPNRDVLVGRVDVRLPTSLSEEAASNIFEGLVVHLFVDKVLEFRLRAPIDDDWSPWLRSFDIGMVGLDWGRHVGVRVLLHSGVDGGEPIPVMARLVSAGEYKNSMRRGMAVAQKALFQATKPSATWSASPRVSISALRRVVLRQYWQERCLEDNQTPFFGFHDHRRFWKESPFPTARSRTESRSVYALYGLDVRVPSTVSEDTAKDFFNNFRLSVYQEDSSGKELEKINFSCDRPSEILSHTLLSSRHLRVYVSNKARSPAGDIGFPRPCVVAPDNSLRVVVDRYLAERAVDLPVEICLHALIDEPVY